MWWGLLLLGLGAAARPCIPSGNEIPINDALAQGEMVSISATHPRRQRRGRGTVRGVGPPPAGRDPLHRAGTEPADCEIQRRRGHWPFPRDAHRGGGRTVHGDFVRQRKDASDPSADCKQCGDATIKNLVIDGNRPQLLRVPLGGALIEVGNAERQSVTGCRLYEPRGWSALHIREGDNLNCRRAYIADNVIGPCGEEWDDDYDGLIEKEPPFGNPRADGISIACKDSVVERNVREKKRTPDSRPCLTRPTARLSSLGRLARR